MFRNEPEIASRFRGTYDAQRRARSRAHKQAKAAVPIVNGPAGQTHA